MLPSVASWPAGMLGANVQDGCQPLLPRHAMPPHCRLYKYTVWPLFREPLVRSGSYSMHMALVYVLLAVLCTLTGLIAWMTFVICSDEQERQRHKRSVCL